MRFLWDRQTGVMLSLVRHSVLYRHMYANGLLVRMKFTEEMVPREKRQGQAQRRPRSRYVPIVTFHI